MAVASAPALDTLVAHVGASVCFLLLGRACVRADGRQPSKQASGRASEREIGNCCLARAHSSSLRPLTAMLARKNASDRRALALQTARLKQRPPLVAFERKRETTSDYPSRALVGRVSSGQQAVAAAAARQAHLSCQPDWVVKQHDSCRRPAGRACKMPARLSSLPARKKCLCVCVCLRLSASVCLLRPNRSAWFYSPPDAANASRLPLAITAAARTASSTASSLSAAQSVQCTVRAVRSVSWQCKPGRANANLPRSQAGRAERLKSTTDDRRRRSRRRR